MRSGQAMIEFVVALIAVMVLAAGLVQIGLLSKAHTDVMTEARTEAGEHAVTPVVGGTAPDYIEEWENGPDDVSYSADDESTDGDSRDIVLRMVGRARPSDLYEQIGDNPVSDLFYDPSTLMSCLVNGHSEKNVALLPVIKDMAYADDSIDVKSDVWMVKLGEIY